MEKQSNIVLVTGLILGAVLMGGCPQQAAREGSPTTSTGTVSSAPTGTAAGHGTAVNMPVAEALPAGQWWGDGCDPHRQGSTAATGPAAGEELFTVETGRLSGRLGVLPGGLVIAGLAGGVKAVDLVGNIAWDVSVRGEFDSELTSGPPGGEIGIPGFHEGDMPFGGGPGGPLPTGEIHPAAGEEGGPGGAGESSPGTDGNGGSPPGGAPRLDTAEGAIDFVISAVPEPRVYLRCNYTTDEEVTLFGQVPGTYARRACDLRAYDAGGRELWRLGFDGSLKGQPCVTEDGAIFGLQMVSDPVIHDLGYMEKYQEKAELLRVSAAGDMEWHKILPRLDATGAPPEETALVMLRDGNVGFVWADRYFHVFSADSFRRWDLELKSTPDGPPAVSPEGLILVQGTDRPNLNEKQLELMKWSAMNVYGVVHSLKPTGVRHWDLQAGSDVHTPLVIDAGGRVYFATEIFADDRGGGRSHGMVYCLNAKGQLEYELELPDPPVDDTRTKALVVDAAGTLYLADRGGNLSAISRTGEILWQAAIDGRFTTNPVICGGMVFIGAEDRLCAFGEKR